MFTGIITDLGTVLDVNFDGGDARYKIQTGLPLENTAMGASIACDGCCLTVIEKGSNWFSVDVSEETLSKTTLRHWKKNKKINLEASLKIGDEIGGHIVSGHVDGQAEVISVSQEGDSHRFTFMPPKDLAKFIAPKGSIALNGVSLTINEVNGDNSFGINIIAHTWDVTNFHALQSGDKLNMEIDMLARYVARLMDALG